MRIIDISMPVRHGMKVYKNKEEKRPLFRNQSNYDYGSHYETSVQMDLHTGTHMDAPLHMIQDGGTIDKVSLSKCMGSAKVLDFTHLDDGISEKDLRKKEIAKGDIILLKTRNSFEDTFNFKFIYLKADGAKYLVKLGVKAIGIDALGIERDNKDHETHKAILGSGIPIIEGLVLKEVDEGDYEFIGLPLKLEGVEGSPLRAILIDK